MEAEEEGGEKKGSEYDSTELELLRADDRSLDEKQKPSSSQGVRGHYFALAGATVTLISLALCWVVTMSAVGHRREGVELPVLSETGINAPEKFFFTGGLSIAALCFSISSIYLYQFISLTLSTPSLQPLQQQPQRDSCWRKWISLQVANRINLLVGQLSCLFLFLLALVDLGVYPLLHGSFSAVFFLLSIAQGAIACGIIAIIRRKRGLLLSKPDTISFWIKVSTWLLCIFSWIGIPILGSIVLVMVLKAPPSQTMLHNFSAITQYSLVVSLMLHYTSYVYELKKISWYSDFRILVN